MDIQCEPKRKQSPFWTTVTTYVYHHYRSIWRFSEDRWWKHFFSVLLVNKYVIWLSELKEQSPWLLTSDVSFAHLLAMNTPAYILNFLMVFTYLFFLIYTKYEYIRINQLFFLSEKSLFITFTNPTFHWLCLWEPSISFPYYSKIPWLNRSCCDLLYVM